MKFAIAVLVGLVAAEEPVWSLRSVNDHRTDSQVQKAYGDHSTTKANSRPPYDSTMQISESDDEQDVLLNGDDEEVDHSGESYYPHEHSMEGNGGYERVTTARFAADTDDIFMRSMIQNYALEAKNKDGSPSGAFWMDEAASRAAASEVLETHKGMHGEALQNYLNTYWAKAWGHFDVNRVGKVEVIKMPQLMRFLASDQYMYLW